MRDGGAAELCLVPERMVYRVPNEMAFELAHTAGWDLLPVESRFKF